MKRILTGVLVLALAVAVLPGAPPARADGGAVVVDGDVVVDAAAETATDGSDTERWWGAAGAIICGGGINLIRHFWPAGLSVPVVASTIGGCVLAAMDVATT